MSAPAAAGQPGDEPLKLFSLAGEPSADRIAADLVARLQQRVTLAFDPQKKEGAPQLVEAGHYRFTNANTGEIHDVWVSPDNRITRMTIGDSFELKIEN